MNKSSKILALLIAFISTSLLAQGPQAEMADTMRANGKIYVVVLVLGIIFAGIVVYLIWIDRKLRKLEKESEK